MRFEISFLLLWNRRSAFLQYCTLLLQKSECFDSPSDMAAQSWHVSTVNVQCTHMPQAQGQWSHKAMTCACGMCVQCTLLHTCPLVLLAHANFAQPCQRESRNIPIFEIKECNIVGTHSCDSKEAKIRSRNAFLDSNQQNRVFKYH